MNTGGKLWPLDCTERFLFQTFYLVTSSLTGSIIKIAQVNSLSRPSEAVWPVQTKFLADNEKFPFNPFPNKHWVLCVCSTSPLKTLGKGDINCNEQFLLFTQCFLPVWKTLPFSSNLKLSSANSFSLEESEICCLRKS